MEHTPPLGNHRYRLIERVGAGGMGIVSRAYDRLTGQEVALKQVNLPTTDHDGETEADLHLLANEFQVLSGLRHPHIISVLDYGFDTERRPFYTMELLEQAQTLLDAGRSLPQPEQIQLLIQALEALAYLHHRRILHHDLKPANILVVDQHLRLLDFGLAVLAHQQRSHQLSGTIQYLAPEVLDGEPYSEAADLYSFGIIAAELLTGRHPFDAEDLPTFLDQVFSNAPDLGSLPESAPELAELLTQLLAKHPWQRPTSAQATIERLRASTGATLGDQSPAIRESYLQAADFVGREQEFGQLTSALSEARHGHPRYWLIGGESGVGKSRLLDELRTHALVEGFLVLNGQGIEGGGSAYQLWREPLRMLVLTTPLSDLEASVLHSIVPDIAMLLEREISAAPTLSGAENFRRIVRVVIDLLSRQEQPLALLLEDIHWAEESLSLLQEVFRLLGQSALLVVATYRNDERPDLPSVLPEAQHLLLNRLNTAGIAQLSSAMLGERGRHADLLALLERETEGNVFFMVEVVRALAEEAGSLANVASITLPAHVFTGGVQRLVSRRLQRVPAASRPLLELAAVLGRQIDTAALQAITTRTDLTAWLFACGEAQVLEVRGDQWRFTHDKLREGVLHSLTSTQHQQLHAQAAMAIEHAYAHDLAPQAARLADHFHHAGMPAREQQYAYQAGSYAQRVFAHSEAIRQYSRALALSKATDEQFTILLAREDSYDWLGDRDRQQADLEALATLAEQLADNQRRLEVGLRSVRQALSLRDFPTAIARATTCLPLAQTTENQAAEATARLHWGVAHYRQNEFEAARAQLLPALTQARALGLHEIIADCLLHLGIIADLIGDLLEAQTLLNEALALTRTSADRQREARALNALSVNSSRRGEQQAKVEYLNQALQINRLIGRPDGECIVLVNFGINAQMRGDYDQAEEFFDQALPLARLIGDRLIECYIFGEQSKLARILGDFATARARITEVIDRARAIGVPEIESQMLTELHLIAMELGEYQQAEATIQQARQVAETANLSSELQMAWLQIGDLQLEHGQFDAATAAYQTVLTMVADQLDTAESVGSWMGLATIAQTHGDQATALGYVEQILAWLADHEPFELIAPFETYLCCYRVLAAQGDPRAHDLLTTGWQLLHSQAERIGDPQRRERFLAATKIHRELRAAWAAAQSA